MDFLRKFFGFNDANRSNYYPREDNNMPNSPSRYPPNDETERFFNLPSDTHRNEYEGAFNVFTDPLEMHRYFEQQMNEVLKMFGFPSFGHFESSDLPSIDGILGNHEEQPNNLREHFLKNGYEVPHYQNHEEKMDKDLDGKLNIGDFNSVFKSPSSENSVKVYKPPKSFGGNFFNKSVQVKTVRKPDGTVETHKTMRDSDGNEETIISQKKGEKEYTIITKRDKEGREEISETLVNMNENDKSLFKDAPDVTPSFGSDSNNYSSSSLFRKFFS